MKTLKLTLAEITDLQPTSVGYAAERGQVLGGIEIKGEIDHSAIEAKAVEYFGEGAELDGEGDDGDECVHFVVTRSR